MGRGTHSIENRTAADKQLVIAFILLPHFEGEQANKSVPKSNLLVYISNDLAALSATGGR